MAQLQSRIYGSEAGGEAPSCESKDTESARAPSLDFASAETMGFESTVVFACTAKQDMVLPCWQEVEERWLELVG